jgi:undecaprenyl phosphate-alpha-L-ara4FN deformylase
MNIGLRIDVDTFKGTQYGVPNLLKLLDEYDIKATFFFSVGPDNMGRHFWRLMRPVFLKKMIRSNAAKLYGWEILRRGILWPGPVIGSKLAPIIKKTFQKGHEIGLHAWDHYAWQQGLDKMSAQDIHTSIKKGFELLTQINGKPPTCSAAPAWRCNDEVLIQKEQFLFAYNSDCRGKTIFCPVVKKKLHQPQIPTTLPTYDEVIGQMGISDSNYNDYILALLKHGKLNVLTIHAEVEGIVCLSMFETFIQMSFSKGHTFKQLRVLLENTRSSRHGFIIAQKINGREGWVACQR